MEIAEHYAVSAYIFLAGSVLHVLARKNKFFEDFFTIDYSQILHMATVENVFDEKTFSEKFNQKAVSLIPLAIFVFLLLSPLFNFLLINEK